MYSVVYNIGWVYVLWGHSEHSCYCYFITRLRVTLAIHSGWPLDWLAVLVVTMFLRIWTIGPLSSCVSQVMVQNMPLLEQFIFVVHSERRGSERDSVRSPWRVNMGGVSGQFSTLCWSFPKTRKCGKCSVDITKNDGWSDTFLHSFQNCRALTAHSQWLSAQLQPLRQCKICLYFKKWSRL